MKRLTFLVFGLLIGTSSLFAQCVNGDCTDGTGIFLFPSGAKYIGQFKSSKMHGIGSCYYTDGSKYQGEWEDSYPQGDGIKTLANGTQIRGKWLRGQLQEAPPPPKKEIAAAESPINETTTDKPTPKKEKVQTGCVSGNCQNGKGIYIYPSGAIYIGEFSDGEIHGIGACYYSDGSKYQGEWIFRYPEGRGTKTFADGTKWTGQWRKGQPLDDNGKIIEDLFPDKQLATADTDVQTGCVEGDCLNGSGTFAYADGSKYEGKFRENKPHGQGIFYDVTGEKYVGSFKNGIKHGEGTLYHPNGTQTTGEWKAGEYIGQPELADNKTGCVQGDCTAGRGTFVFKEDHSKYVGAFAMGKPEGSGVMYYPNGERFSGQWKDGKYHGQGVLFLMDGTEVRGIWEEGKYMDEVMAEAPNHPATVQEAPKELRRMKIWAVVVGVSSYNHMPTLRYTDDDAYRMYAFLKSPEGGALSDDQIRILIDEDATKERIKSVMEEVFMQAEKDDLVLLYYSGHGLKGAFLPIDFDGFNNRLEHDEINSILASSPAKYKLCIADACHSGSLLAMKSANIKGVLDNYYETLAQAEPGTALIMSSKSEETSLESSGLRQGVFSHFLIRGLKGEADRDNNRVVTIDELYEYILNKVKKYTGNRQSPVIKGDFDPNMTVSVVREGW